MHCSTDKLNIVFSAPQDVVGFANCLSLKDQDYMWVFLGFLKGRQFINYKFCFQKNELVNSRSYTSNIVRNSLIKNIF